MLLFVNLTDSVLTNPTLSILPTNSTSSSTSSLLTGQAQALTALNPRAVWATLIPGDAVKVNATISGSTTSILGTTLIDGQMAYIKAARPDLTVTPNITGLQSIALSPNGQQIYGVNPTQNALVSVNASDLTQRQLFKDGLEGVNGLGGATDLTISRDGNHVYVTSPGDRILSVFQRNATNGNLSLVQELPISGRSLESVAISSDGNRVYAAGTNGLQAFNRNTTTGVLTTAQTSLNLGGVSNFSNIAVSNNGSVLYAASRTSDSLLVVNASNLSVIQSISGAVNGLDGAKGLAISSDDRFVYVTGQDGNTLSVFQRDTTTQNLTLVQTLQNSVNGVRGLLGASDVTVTPDGRYVMVTGTDSNAVAVFEQDTSSGRLQFAQLLRNNVGGATGLQTPTAIATNANGTKTFVSSLGITGSNGGLAVFDTNTLQPEPTTILTTFDNIEALVVSTASGEDVITLRQAPSPKVLTTTINTGDGNDSVILQALSSTTVVNLGTGNDTAQLRAETPSSNLTVRGQGGDDTINIERVGTSSRTEVFGGDGRDTVRVSGANLPTSATTIAHGDNPNGVPQTQGDTLIFDPQNPNPNTPNYTPAPPTAGAGSVNVNSRGVLQYDTFEGNVVVIAAPIISFSGQPYQINEGQSVTLQANVTPLGQGNALSGPVIWDINGDGSFGDVSGATVTLTWAQLVDLGLGDNGTYQIGVRATNTDSFSSSAFTNLIINNTPPSIQVNGVNEVAVGSPYTINFSATDPGNDRVFEWRINWGDGTPVEVFGSGTTSATHIYTNPGTAQIVVGAVDEDSTPNATLAAPKTITVTVSANQVSAGSPYTIAEGEALTLDAIAIGTPTAYAWDINGDGIFTDATGKNPTLLWTQLQQLAANPIQNNGTYNVRVRVSYSTGQQATSNPVTLLVTNTAPTATFINSGAVNEGSTTTVSFIDRFDPSLSDTTAGFFYSYDFNNDGQFEVINSNSSSVVVPNQFLSDNGTRTIRGVIQDQDGGATELFTEVTVLAVAPTLIVSGADTAVEGVPYSLDLSANDPGNDTVSQWIVDWNDGTIETFAGATQSLTHRFTDNGTRVILVTAIDEDGTYTTTKTVAVSNTAPQLQNLSATTAVEGSISRLTGKIVDPGTQDSFTLLVNWGDGSSETFNFAAGTTDFDLSHQYGDNQDYVIIATVTDKDSASNTATTIARINNAAPAIAGLLLANTTVTENGLVVVSGRITDPGIGDTHTVSINWGDGTTSAATVDASTRTFTASRRYADDNPTATAVDNYTITATVTDDDGASASASTIVTVTNVAPVITSFQRTETKVNRSNSVSITGGFNDIGLSDTHTVTIDWGNGTTTNAVVDATTGQFTATYNYTVISGDGSRSNLNGTSGNDRIFGGLNGKTITGGAGSDEFIYTDLREVGHRIADFEVGKDKINLSQLLDSLVIGGYQGTDAIADGYVRLVQGSTANSTTIQIDRDGRQGTAVFRSFLIIDNVGLAAMNNPSNFIYNDVDNYIVTVTVTDDDGGSDTTSTTASKRI
ncbi:hypothetical protein CV014_19930 [Nostoc sp. CMAA1605]|nr:hypothetical protein [Nostoc sp. CMAA1605]